MRRLFYTITVIGLALAIQGCSSGKKAYQKGNYEDALESAIKRLRKSPNNDKAIATLKNAYPDFLEFYQEQIADAKRSSDPLRYEKVMRLYSQLNKTYKEIQRAPAAREALPEVRNFTDEYEEAKRNAAEARYALGEQAIAKGYREDAKEAFYHYEKALDFMPNYRDAEDKMWKARDMATVIIQVEEIPMHSRTYELTNEFFENKMLEYFRKTTFSPFVIFATTNEIREGKLREADHIVRMAFDDFVVGQTYVKEKEASREKENVVIREVKVSEDSTRKEYGTVKATVTQFTKEISSSGLLDVKIIDARTNGVVSQQKFPGTFVYYDYWGFFNGDERALNKDDKKFIKKKREAPNPLPQDLFIEFTKPIFDQTTAFISDFYTSF